MAVRVSGARAKVDRETRKVASGRGEAQSRDSADATWRRGFVYIREQTEARLVEYASRLTLSCP